jgi:penicillin-binding protein 1C
MLNLIRNFLIFIGHPVYVILTSPVKIIRSLIKIKIGFSYPAITTRKLLKKIYPAVAFVNSLKPKPLHLTPTKIFILRGITLLFFLIIFSLSIGAYLFVFKDLPNPESLQSQSYPLTTHILDRNGHELFKIYKSENRTLVRLADLPQSLITATISIEDANFYNHQGFSIKGIARAALQNTICYLKNQNCAVSLQGGSTITQQLVKTSLLTPERTIQRKLKELILSIWVERLYSKDQILEMYLNRVAYGGTLYGVQEASQAYFGIDPKDLSLGQSAFLAGLPASPTTYSPYGSHPELAKTRQTEVLASMVKFGHITWEQADAASGQELVILPPQNSILAPHFVMYVRELLSTKYGPDLVDQGGLEVITSLDLSIQNKAQQAVTEETAKVAYLKVGNGAALVTNPNTGEILAMVGSRDYFDIKNDGNVNVTLMPRQPGSSIKPINYALALTRGFTPASIIEDTPITYHIAGQPPYSPLNYDRRFHGRVTLRSALANSYNIPAVKILAANGVDRMIDLAQKMGISTWNDRNRFGLSLTLGGGEVTMTDMAVTYGVLANSGQRTNLHPILSVRNSMGHILEEYRCPSITLPAPSTTFSQNTTFKTPPTEVTSCTQDYVLDPKVSYLISDILSDNVARTPVFGARSDLFIPGQSVSVKTGTTNDLRDNWTIGYTPDFVAVVWVGNNDNSPMSYVASGVTGASPIWRRIFNHLLTISPHPTLTPPSNLLKLEICTITGELACGPACPTRTEYFIPGTQPKKACNPELINKLRDDKAERDKLLNGATTP